MSPANLFGCFILKKSWTEDVVIQQSSQPWNDATDRPLCNEEDYHSSLLEYQQALWSFLLTHIDADVDHLIKLLVDNPQTSLNMDTDKLWIIIATIRPTK